jgi:hypothetical protein
VSDLEQFLGQFKAEPLSPMQAALAASRIEDAKAEKDAAREAAERELAAEERAESMAFKERALGRPWANINAERADLERVNDELADLQERCRKLEARRDRSQENIRFWAERLEAANPAPATGFAQAQAEADKVRALFAREAAIRARQAQPAPRPFARRSASAAAAAANGSGSFPPGCSCLYRTEQVGHTHCWPSHPLGATDLPDSGDQAERGSYADWEELTTYRQGIELPAVSYR